jgi:hypothetical protein
MADTILETMLKDPEFRRKYVDEKARMDVAQLFADVMAERGWDEGQLAEATGSPNRWHIIQLMQGNFNLTFTEVAQMLDRLDMDLVVTARKREVQNG